MVVRPSPLWTAAGRLSLVSRGCVGRILVPAVTGWKEGATNALLTPFGIPWTP